MKKLTIGRKIEQEKKAFLLLIIDKALWCYPNSHPFDFLPGIFSCQCLGWCYQWSRASPAPEALSPSASAGLSSGPKACASQSFLGRGNVLLCIQSLLNLVVSYCYCADFLTSCSLLFVWLCYSWLLLYFRDINLPVCFCWWLTGLCQAQDSSVKDSLWVFILNLFSCLPFNVSFSFLPPSCTLSLSFFHPLGFYSLFFVSTSEKVSSPGAG